MKEGGYVNLLKCLSLDNVSSHMKYLQYLVMCKLLVLIRKVRLG